MNRQRLFIAVCMTAAVLGGCGAKEADAAAAAGTEQTAAGIENGSEASDAKDENLETAGSGAGTLMTDGSGIRTEKTGTGDPEGMTLYAELSFYLGDVEWRLQKFAQSDLVDHGELLLDDRCRFLIRAVSGDGAYVFFDEAVQLGEPEADVWTDPEDRLHVVIRDARTARYRITDHIYDKDTEVFNGRVLIGEDGINYWGTAAGNGGGLSLETEGQEEMETLCGYIQKIENGAVWIDQVEYVEESDMERIRELGLTEADMAGGFYIYNPEEESVPLTLADDAVYTFIDWGRDFIPSDSSQDLTVSTTTLALFEAYLETYEDGKPGMPFFMETDGDRVIRIFEKPMAYKRDLRDCSRRSFYHAWIAASLSAVWLEISPSFCSSLSLTICQIRSCIHWTVSSSFLFSSRRRRTSFSRLLMSWSFSSIITLFLPRYFKWSISFCLGSVQ